MAEATPRVQVNTGAFASFLRRIYQAGPLDRGALAIVACVDQVLSRARDVRNALSPDVYLERGLQTWDRDATALGLRIGIYLDVIRESLTVPRAQRLQIVDSRVSWPILLGIYNADLFTNATHAATANLTKRPDGNYALLGGDAVLAASLLNRALAASDADTAALWGAESKLRNVFATVRAEMEQSAPGEETTVADGVLDGLQAAEDAVGTLVAKITESSLALKLVIGGAVLAGVWLLLRE